MSGGLVGLVVSLLLFLGTANAQGLTVRGEVGLHTGVAAAREGGETGVLVPVAVRASIELHADLGGGAEFRAQLLPALGGGTDADPLLVHGLQEAFFRLRFHASDLSAGFERAPLAQMRLIEPVGIEPRLETGEPRGPLAARVRYYSGAWRASAALLALTGEDLLPEGAGGAISLRHESPALTLEGHALWSSRPGFGLTASGSLGALVAYGEGWLLLDPWEGRGGVGVSGYRGEWLLTAEAGWGAPAGDLLLPSGPTAAMSASRPLGLTGSLEAALAASWVGSPTTSAGRARLGASVSLRQDREDASLVITPAIQIAEQLVVPSLNLSLRTYY